jgi:hypothetical protein
MFTTVNNVLQYTNKEVDLGLISRAQSVIEVYIGRSEIDIENPNDINILDKMTAYQAAYMMDNEDVVFTQIAALSTGNGDTNQNYDTKMSAPFIAPLAVFASRGLSFNKGRSIRTGKIFQWNRKVDWRTL